MPIYHIAFWNLENLFDVEDSPDRPEWLQRELASELEGWRDEILSRKLERLAHIIRRINDGQGPDILGVCEVENERVLRRLVEAIGLEDRIYSVAHADTNDGRGIDVAFLFDATLFEKREQFSHVILKRTATRDLFQVNLRSRHSGNELILIGNHWPARSAGQYETEPYRILAAETLSYFLKRILEIKGNDAAMLVMGDFNDEPFDLSLTDYALSTRQRQKVLNARSPRIFNLMWSLLGERLGTHYHHNFAAMLDQFLVSNGLIRQDSAFTVEEASSVLSGSRGWSRAATILSRFASVGLARDSIRTVSAITIRYRW